ncbi:MAG: hypothetical protein HY738_01800 [Bacteroidia bacterium]|nr:hypothetical protein [Bacteroidia bacterium]
MKPIILTNRFRIIVLGLFFLFSCTGKEKFEIDKSGLEYKFILKSGSSIKPKKNELLILNMKYFAEKNDSLLFSTQDVSRKFRMQMRDPSHGGGCIEDAFALMEAGDSIKLRIEAQLFYTETKKMPIPAFVKPGDKLLFFIKLEEIESLENHYEEVRGVR